VALEAWRHHVDWDELVHHLRLGEIDLFLAALFAGVFFGGIRLGFARSGRVDGPVVVVLLGPLVALLHHGVHHVTLVVHHNFLDF